VVTFGFYPSKLKNQPFFANNFKIPAPLPRPLLTDQWKDNAFPTEDVTVMKTTSEQMKSSWIFLFVIKHLSSFALKKAESRPAKWPRGHGRPQKFFQDANILLIFLRLMMMQYKLMFVKRFTPTTQLYHKETAPCYNNGHKKCASLAAMPRYIPIIFTMG